MGEQPKMFAGLKKMMGEERESLLGKVALGTGVTGGGVAVYEFFECVKANPVATLGLVKSFGAEFVIAVILIGLVNRLIGVMEKSATSSQEMADAIRQIADKDDRQAERMQLLTQYSAQTSEDVATAMGKFSARMDLQDSALDRIERRQAEMKAGIDAIAPPASPPRPALVEKGQP